MRRATSWQLLWSAFGHRRLYIAAVMDVTPILERAVAPPLASLYLSSLHSLDMRRGGMALAASGDDNNICRLAAGDIRRRKAVEAVLTALTRATAFRRVGAADARRQHALRP